MEDEKTTSVTEETVEQTDGTATQEEGAEPVVDDRHEGITITSGVGVKDNPASESKDATGDAEDEEEAKPSDTTDPKDDAGGKDSPESPKDDGKTDAKPKAKQTPQERINQAVKKQRDAERHARILEKENEELRAGTKAAPKDGDAGVDIKPDAEDTKPQEQDEPEPKEEDFDDYTDYAKALVKWEVKQSSRQHVDIDAIVDQKVEARLAPYVILCRSKRNRKA
ncbi:MAG: hypothetical protein JRD89_20945 [Deltaproteobacteria bacterium]|nr:hypothetical protein [Deltaproteobacteria bacterium]